MKRLLVLTVAAAASFAVSTAPASADQQCPPVICNALDMCYDTGEVRFCL